MSLLDAVRASGLVGLLIIALFFPLLIAGGLMLAFARGRALFVVYLLAACIPMALALLGMQVAKIEMRNMTMAMAGAVTPADLAQGHLPVRALMWMGLVSSGLFWAMGLAGLILKGAPGAGGGETAPPATRSDE